MKNTKMSLGLVIFLSSMVFLGVGCSGAPSAESDSARADELMNKVKAGQELTQAEKNEMSEINKRDFDRTKAENAGK